MIEHLTLPQTLDVERDLAAEAALYDEVKAWLMREQRTEGVHASDLLFPRKGYFRQVDPQPLEPRQIGLFMVGKVLHAFVLRHRDLSADEGSLYSETLGIWYSPDSRDPLCEIKTSRSYYEPRTLEDLETYLHQLLVYQAAESRTEGRLIVLYINARDDTGRTSPAFRVYKVTLSEEELVSVRLNLRRLRDQIVDALNQKDHRGLPLCPEWSCGPNECSWFNKCQPEGRFADPKWLKRKERK